MSLLDAFRAIGNPEGYIDSMDRRPDRNAEVYKQLYGTGYENERVPTVREARTSGLGELLQAVGILGEPPSRELTPYERFIYNQGTRDRSAADLTQQGKELDYQTAKERAMYNALLMGRKAFDMTGVPSPEFVQNWPDLAGDYEGMIKESKKDKVTKDKIDRLRMDAARADYRWKMQGVRGERKTASARSQDQRDTDLFNSWSRSPTGARLLNIDIPKYVGDPKNIMNQKGELGKMEKMTDPVLIQGVIKKWVLLKQQIRQTMLSEGISPERVENFIQTLPDYGRLERDPNLVFGEPGSTRTGAIQTPNTTNPPPDAQQKFMDTLDNYEQSLEE